MNSFASRATLKSGDRSYTIYRLPALEERGFNLSRLPFSLKILLENLLRREDGVNVTAGDIEFLANWDAKAEPTRGVVYRPLVTVGRVWHAGGLCGQFAARVSAQPRALCLSEVGADGLSQLL